MIKIRIRNDDHEIDLQFPISENKLYAKLAEIHAIEGKDAPQSAFVTEVYWPEELSMLKDRFANLDELNYLAALLAQVVKEKTGAKVRGIELNLLDSKIAELESQVSQMPSFPSMGAASGSQPLNSPTTETRWALGAQRRKCQPSPSRWAPKTRQPSLSSPRRKAASRSLYSMGCLLSLGKSSKKSVSRFHFQK